MQTPEVGEDVGPQSPQNFVPESVLVCIILSDTGGLRIKMEGFNAMEDVGNIILLCPLKQQRKEEAVGLAFFWA